MNVPGVIEGLIGVVIGALATNLAQFLIQQLQRRQSTAALATAVAADLRATTELVDRREYLRHLDEQIAHLAVLPPSTPVTDFFVIFVEQDYLAVFNTYLPRLGELGELAGPVVRAYTLGKGILEDLANVRRLREATLKGATPHRDVVMVLTTHLRDLMATTRTEALQTASALEEFARRRRQYWLLAVFRRCSARSSG